MTKEFARKIADKFIKEHNPNLWDGLGNMPSNFSREIEVYNIFNKKVYMTIQFEIDADEGGCWAHIVKLYSNKDGCNDELLMVILEKELIQRLLCQKQLWIYVMIIKNFTNKGVCYV